MTLAIELAYWQQTIIKSVAVLASLQYVDAFLKIKNVTQPFVIQETFYDDPGVATNVRNFMQGTSRKLDELMEWPVTVNAVDPNLNVEPPYSLSNYLGLPK